MAASAEAASVEAASAEAVGLRITGFQHRGQRQCMEDYFSMNLQENTDGRDHVYACFGVFAGHGGKEAAEYAKDNLINAITESPKFWSGDDSQVLTAIREGYTSVQQVMYKYMWKRWKRGAQGQPSIAGTTATICFVMRGKLFIANVGDSGLVLASSTPQRPYQWKAKRLTKDHRPDDPKEYARVRSAGARTIKTVDMPNGVTIKTRLINFAGNTCYQDFAMLNMTRSLGDFWSYNVRSGKFIVSPDPDVYVHKLDMTHDKCIILASDGLWDKVSAHAAVKTVRSIHFENARRNGTWYNPSKNLCAEALEQGMLLDQRNRNITVITVLLKRILTPRVVGEIPKLQDKQRKVEDVVEETLCRVTI